MSKVSKIRHFGVIPVDLSADVANRTATFGAGVATKQIFDRTIEICSMDGGATVTQGQTLTHYFEIPGEAIKILAYESDVQAGASSGFTPDLSTLEIFETYDITLPDGRQFANATLICRNLDGSSWSGSDGYTGFTPQIIHSNYAKQIYTRSSGTPAGWAAVSNEAKEKFEFYFNNEVIETPAEVHTRALTGSRIIVTNTTDEDFTYTVQTGYEDKVNIEKYEDNVVITVLDNTKEEFNIVFTAKGQSSTTKVINELDTELTAKGFGYYFTITGETYKTQGKLKQVTAEYTPQTVGSKTYTKAINPVGTALRWEATNYNFASVIYNDTLPEGTYYGINRGDYNSLSEANKRLIKVFQDVSVNTGIQITGKVLYLFNENFIPEQQMTYYKYWKPSKADDPSFATPVVNNGIILGWYPESDEAKFEAYVSITDLTLSLSTNDLSFTELEQEQTIDITTDELATVSWSVSDSIKNDVNVSCVDRVLRIVTKGQAFTEGSIEVIADLGWKKATAIVNIHLDTALTPELTVEPPSLSFRANGVGRFGVSTTEGQWTYEVDPALDAQVKVSETAMGLSIAPLASLVNSIEGYIDFTATNINKTATQRATVSIIELPKLSINPDHIILEQYQLAFVDVETNVEWNLAIPEEFIRRIKVEKINDKRFTITCMDNNDFDGVIKVIATDGQLDVEEDLVVHLRYKAPPEPPLVLNEEQQLVLDTLKSHCANLSLTDEEFLSLYIQAEGLARIIYEGLEPYVDESIIKLIKFNLLLHYVITSPLSKELYTQYGVEGKEYMISSASNSGSSTSMQNFKSLDEGRFLMLDLFRTPFGKLVYSLLEQINPAIVIL